MTYLIAGASSDMGRELIKCIDRNEDGAIIYAHYNKGKAKLEKLKEELNLETKIVPVQADLSEADGVLKLLERIKEKKLAFSNKEDGDLQEIKDMQLPEINKFVFMPAYPFNYMRLKELDINKIKVEMQISAYSFLELCKELIPNMKKMESPVILAMLTKYVTDELPPKFMTDYIVSKYALMGAVKSLQAEHGNKIKIEYIAPDMVDTAFLNNIDPRIVEMNREANGLLKAEDVAQEMYRALN